MCRHCGEYLNVPKTYRNTYIYMLIQCSSCSQLQLEYGSRYHDMNRDVQSVKKKKGFGYLVTHFYFWICTHIWTSSGGNLWCWVDLNSVKSRNSWSEMTLVQLLKHWSAAHHYHLLWPPWTTHIWKAANSRRGAVFDIPEGGALRFLSRRIQDITICRNLEMHSFYPSDRAFLNRLQEPLQLTYYLAYVRN